MIKDKLIALKQELLSFSLKERLFLVAAMLCGFCISAEYAIVRPVSNSVFVHAYSSQFFPFAWIATVPLNLLIVSLYNRFLPKLGCLKMFFYISFLIAFGNVFCALFMEKISFLPFLFYIWKEVYIMLMFQQLWSVIHTAVNFNRAKYLYGIIFGVGGAGGAIGSLIPGFFAVSVGSETLLFLSLPIYVLLFALFYWMLRNSGKAIEELRAIETPTFWESVKSISASRFLALILMLVLFMQLTATIVDYQFNSVLEKAVPDKDLRTEYAGKVFGIINTSTILLQFVGTFLLIQFLGIRRSHFFVPLTLCLNAIGFLFFPVLGMISFSFITIKAFDFSLFGVIKEILYIPLKVEEKFRAKAIIDVFAYRSSKALASALIFSLQFFAGIEMLSLLTWGSIVLFGGWCLLVALMFKKSLVLNSPTQ